jgi:hypothetical protein
VAAAVTAPSIVDRFESRVEPQSVRGRPNAAQFEAALGKAKASEAVLVAPVRTQLDWGQASGALREALRNVLGEEPSDSSVRVLTAQWAHETGRGASMFNYNFGGIKGAGPSGLSVAQRTHEGFGASERTIVDRFRAYRTAEEGATDYVHLLRARFPEALEAARQGDPVGFVRALKSRGYFTGDEAAYTRSVASLSGVELPSHAAPLPPALDVQRVSPAIERPVEPERVSVPNVDALAFADEISRAALRIAASTRPEEERS